MSIDPKIFADLRMTPAQQRDFKLAFPQNTNPEVINQELVEMKALREIGKNKTKQLAKDMGLKLTHPINPFTESWQNYTNEFKMTAQLAPSATPERDADGVPYFTYDGRDIETHIQSTVSNTAFNPNNISEIFDSIYKAAIDISPKNARKIQYINELESTHREFMHGTTYPKKSKRLFRMPKFWSRSKDDADLNDEDSVIEELNEGNVDLSSDSITGLMDDFKLQKNINSDLNLIVNRAVKLSQLFIGRLAIALWRAETGLTGLPSKQVYAQYVKRIQDRDIQNVCNKKRPVLVNMYKQKVANPESNTSYYVMVTYKPNSDMSSASRSLADSIFSNDWSVTVETVKLRHNPDGSITSTVATKSQFKRSSSIARITYEENKNIEVGKKILANAASNEELDHVYNAFRKLIVQYARDELIRRINNGEKVEDILRDNNLIIKEAYITLLSPLISKSLGKKLTSRFGKAVTTKTIHENEAAQLATTQYCIERMADDTLKFSDNDLDVKEIIRCTDIKANSVAARKIANAKITHKSYYGNYMVNKLGTIRSEALDLSASNKVYYQEGNVQRRKRIREFLHETPELKAKKFRVLNTALNKQLLSKKDSISTELKEIKESYKDLLKDTPNVARIIDLYIDIEAYFNDTDSILRLKSGFLASLRRNKTFNEKELREQERIAASYITAAKDAILAKALGYTPHVTCKSGVDRTGLFSAFMESLAYVDDVSQIDMQLLEENIIASLMHGPHRQVKCLNLIGIAGLQIPSNVLTTMTKLSAFIKANLLSKIGRMGRTMYNTSPSVYAMVLGSTVYKDKKVQRSSRELSSPSAPAPLLHAHKSTQENIERNKMNGPKKTSPQPPSRKKPI